MNPAAVHCALLELALRLPDGAGVRPRLHDTTHHGRTHTMQPDEMNHYVFPGLRDGDEYDTTAYDEHAAGQDEMHRATTYEEHAAGQERMHRLPQ